MDSTIRSFTYKTKIDIETAEYILRRSLLAAIWFHRPDLDIILRLNIYWKLCLRIIQWNAYPRKQRWNLEWLLWILTKNWENAKNENNWLVVWIIVKIWYYR